MPKQICTVTAAMAVALFSLVSQPAKGESDHNSHDGHAEFSIRAVQSGKWSDAATWKPSRVPGEGDRVLVTRGMRVEYDVQSRAVIRLIQDARARAIKLVIVYNAQLKWQKLSFDALRVFANDDLLELHPAE